MFKYVGKAIIVINHTLIDLLITTLPCEALNVPRKWLIPLSTWGWYLCKARYMLNACWNVHRLTLFNHSCMLFIAVVIDALLGNNSLCRFTWVWWMTRISIMQLNFAIHLLLRHFPQNLFQISMQQFFPEHYITLQLLLQSNSLENIKLSLQSFQKLFYRKFHLRCLNIHHAMLLHLSKAVPLSFW